MNSTSTPGFLNATLFRWIHRVLGIRYELTGLVIDDTDLGLGDGRDSIPH